MNYSKIKTTVEAIENSPNEYYEFNHIFELLAAFGYTNPDEIALGVFEVAFKHGGKELVPLLRQLELKHLGTNCNGPDYWLTKMEVKYGLEKPLEN